MYQMTPSKNSYDNQEPWSEYRRLILSELERLEDRANSAAKERQENKDRINNLDLKIRSLELKASILGFIAGTIVSGLIPLLIKLFNPAE